MGFASLQLYATQGLGITDNRTWQFKRLADDLDRLPVLREAVAAGEVGWTKAQQVARVATEATQAAWVAKAVSTGRRELEQQVRKARKRRPTARAAQLGFEVDVTPVAVPPVTINLRADGVQLACFEALVEKAYKLGLVPAGTDRLDLMLAGLETLVAAAAGEHPRSSAPATQIIVQQCPDCAAAFVVTGRGERKLAPAQVEALVCDARVRQVGNSNRATVPPKVRTTVLARDRHRCTTPGCRSTHFLEVHHVTPRAQGGSNQTENLITLCSQCHAFAHENAGALASGTLAPAQVRAGAQEPVGV